MDKNESLWNVLNLNEHFDYKEVDSAYMQLENKTPEAKLAWKILRDEYYSDVYRKYRDIDVVVKAGFILDNLEIEDLDYYNLNLLTTPVNKILDNIDSETSNPVVLITTGGFSPLHDGHLKMMEIAKNELEQNGYNVVGGYISPSHDSYVLTKSNCNINASKRISLCRDIINNSDWLMVDPWESMYVKTYINFTDIVKRLELYLRKHVNNNIQVAYVFGSDNVDFMYCFEDKGIAICIERESFNADFLDKEKQFKRNNTFFVENKSIESKCSSREIRKQQEYEYNSSNNENCDNIYVIRNESIIPLLNYKVNATEDMIKDAQNEFLNEFAVLLGKEFENGISVKIINMIKQLEKSYNILNNKKTISIDSYYQGTYNLEVSRLFDISDIQGNYISLIGRPGHGTIQNQIKSIEAGEYVLVDDDSVSGRTLRGIMSYFPSEIQIKETYLLSSILKGKIFDVVDLRDFIIGSVNGGLVVRLPNGDVARAPYMLPYVCLKTRANIKPSNEMPFSISCWEMNKKIYNSIGKDIKLAQTDLGFKKLMNYLGFEDDALLIDICEWHIKKLRHNEFINKETPSNE